MKSSVHNRVLIVGGGTAGITVAARLARKIGGSDIALIEPSDKHYYQPLWTLVGGGIFPKERAAGADEKLHPGRDDAGRAGSRADARPCLLYTSPSPRD